MIRNPDFKGTALFSVEYLRHGKYRDVVTTEDEYHHQSELVSDVAVPVSVRQAVLF